MSDQLRCPGCGDDLTLYLLSFVDLAPIAIYTRPDECPSCATKLVFAVDMRFSVRRLTERDEARFAEMDQPASPTNSVVSSPTPDEPSEAAHV